MTTALFVPASRADRFDKAFGAGAEAVIFDLEDAVAPADKPAARVFVHEWMVRNGTSASRALVRINTDDPAVLADDLRLLERLAPLGLGGVVVPKVESDGVIAEVAGRVGADVKIVALIESARGIRQIDRIAASGGLTRLAFGAADYTADVGCAMTEQALLLARSEIVTASVAAGLDAPWDSPCFDTSDEAVISRHAAHGRELGFGGSLCIHPVQIGPIRAGYAPTEAQVDWARRILAVSDAEGASRVGNEMVDAPVRMRAQRIVDAHAAYEESKEQQDR